MCCSLPLLFIGDAVEGIGPSWTTDSSALAGPMGNSMSSVNMKDETARNTSGQLSILQEI